jgi:hypothetical protein
LKLTKDISTAIRYHEEEIARRTKSDTRGAAKNEAKTILTKSSTKTGLNGIYTNAQAIDNLKAAISSFQEESDLFLPVLNDTKQLLHDFQSGLYD